MLLIGGLWYQDLRATVATEEDEPVGPLQERARMAPNAGMHPCIHILYNMRFCGDRRPQSHRCLRLAGIDRPSVGPKVTSLCNSEGVRQAKEADAVAAQMSKLPEHLRHACSHQS